MATYTIDSVQDLVDLTLKSGKFAAVSWKDNLFVQTADLDLAGVDPLLDGKGWWPIGYWGGGSFFNGAYDGQGHTISNLTMNRPDNDNGVALFGAIDVDMDGATWDLDRVKNLCLINVNIIGGNYTAGLVGNILAASYVSGYSINNCYITGEITTGRVGGGLIGGSNNGYFVDCYTDVTVNVANSRCDVAGFMGYETIGSRCVNCYSKGLVNNTGPVTGDTKVGGFVGEASGTFTGEDSFWDTETSGQASDGVNGNATGKTTAQMKKEATFTNWDFTNDWWITEDSTYPALRVFGGAPAPSGNSELSFNRGNRVSLGICRGVF